MKKVLGMGNALVDVLMQIENDEVLQELNLPKGSMQLVNKEMAAEVYDKAGKKGSIKASGGSAANTIHALASLGIKTGFIGKVGRDEWGNFFKNDMEISNINTLLMESDSESGRAMALISPDSERTFATFLGAAVELNAQDLVENSFIGYHYFHIEGYLVQNRDLIEEALKLAHKNGLKISLDLASFNVVEENLDFLHSMVSKYVDILFANKEEARSFTGGLEGEAALNWMSELSEIVILKQGVQGSMLKHNNQIIKISPVKVDALDTTGAGDLYAAGFIYGLLHSLPLHKCGEIGSYLSAKIIEVIGPKMDIQTWKEVYAEVQKIATKNL
ncbi:MAG TPA: adenosine kinase [Marinilabiliaceae bacterium]|nr:adenosine kinase [Marinilabiliaceae bacterium]